LSAAEAFNEHFDRRFLVNFWDNAQKLARGCGLALDKVNVKKG